MGRSTPLFAAAGAGTLEAARLLIDGGADPGLSTAELNRPAGSARTVVTPLMAVAAEGHVEMLRLLLERGAALDAVGLSTSIHI
jgi:ankyrin repeat protein